MVGVELAESLGLMTLEGSDDDTTRLSVTEDSANLPSSDALELAEAVLQRLEPADRHEMGRMVYHNAVYSGILLMGMALFWWLTVQVFASELGGTDAPASLILGWNYVTVSGMVPLLIFLSTVLMMLSRERSQPWPGIASGAMLILATFLALEPLGHMTFGDSGGEMLMLSSRLFVLGVMVYYCATMFLDALLLSWVRNLLITFPLDISPLSAGDSVEGQADEGA